MFGMSIFEEVEEKNPIMLSPLFLYIRKAPLVTASNLEVDMLRTVGQFNTMIYMVLFHPLSLLLPALRPIGSDDVGSNGVCKVRIFFLYRYTVGSRCSIGKNYSMGGVGALISP